VIIRRLQILVRLGAKFLQTVRPAEEIALPRMLTGVRRGLLYRHPTHGISVGFLVLISRRTVRMIVMVMSVVMRLILVVHDHALTDHPVKEFPARRKHGIDPKEGSISLV